MLRTELAKLQVHGFQAHGIELGFEPKMAKAALELEHFEFGAGQDGGHEMGGLRGQGFGGLLAHRGVLFERLVVFFHFPPSLVNRGQLGLGQVGVAADQLQNPLAAVLVCKDFSGDEYRRLDGPQIDAQGLRIGKDQRLHGLKPALGAIGFAQGDGAAAFEGENEVMAQGPHRAPVLGRGVPGTGQQVAVGDLLLGHAQQLLQVLVLGKWALAAGFLRLGVINGHRFAHQPHGDGQGQRAGLVEQGDEVEALDVALRAMVPMGANQLVDVGVGLLQHRIIDDKYGEFVGWPPGFGLPNQRLGLAPHLGRAVGGLAEPARDVVAAQRPAQQPRQARGRRRTRRTQQIIRVQVQRASLHKYIRPDACSNDCVTSVSYTPQSLPHILNQFVIMEFIFRQRLDRPD